MVSTISTRVLKCSFSLRNQSLQWVFNVYFRLELPIYLATHEFVTHHQDKKNIMVSSFSDYSIWLKAELDEYELLSLVTHIEQQHYLIVPEFLL